MAYDNHTLEESIKLKLSRDYFKDYDATDIVGHIDYAVAIVKDKADRFETEYLLWAESKKGNKAEFTFDPQENNIVGAYDDRENSLVTVCDVETKSQTPTRYNNITRGEAELRIGIWHVTRKLKLEYV